MIKKMVSLALTFSLIAPVFTIKAVDIEVKSSNEKVLNLNALSQNEAKNLRQIAAVVSTISSALVAADGTEKADTNGRRLVTIPNTSTVDLNRIAILSSTLYYLLASAQEDGDLYMKATSIIQKAGIAKPTGLANPGWDADTRKEVTFAILSEALKQAAHMGVDLAQVQAAEGQIAAQDQRIVRRAVRAVAYALTDAAAQAAVTFCENKCHGIEQDVWEATYQEFIKSVLYNAFFEAAGELIAQEVIAE